MDLNLIGTTIFFGLSICLMIKWTLDGLKSDKGLSLAASAFGLGAFVTMFIIVLIGMSVG